MGRIPLRARDGTIRAYALVDDDDYEELAQYRWSLRTGPNGERYAQRAVPRVTTVLMHRQIMGFPDGRVDHRDGDGLNNQRHNLRRVTNAQNMQNRRGAQRNNRVGLRGVSLDRGKWRAQAQVDGVNRVLGRCETPEAAAALVDAFWRGHARNQPS